MIGYFNTYVQKYWEDNRKVQTYTELGLSLLLLVVLFAFALRPTLLTVLELNKKRGEALEARRRLDEKLQSISLAQASFREVKPDFKLVDAAVPRNKLILDFLNQVQLLAGQNSLNLEGLDYVGEEKGDTKARTNSQVTNDRSNPKGIRSLTFKVEGKGDYTGIKNFVSRLETLPRLVQIDILMVSQGEKGRVGEFGEGVRDQTGKKLEFMVEGRIFYDE